MSKQLNAKLTTKVNLREMCEGELSLIRCAATMGGALTHLRLLVEKCQMIPELDFVQFFESSSRRC